MNPIKNFFCIYSILLLIACSNSSVRHQLDSFFNEFESRIKISDLEKFKNSSIDSSLVFFEMYHSEYMDVYRNKIENDEGAIQYLEDLNLGEDELPGYVFLIYEFHSIKTKKSYTIDDYKMIWKQYLNEKSGKKAALRKKHENELIDQINTTDRKFKVGDTLNLIFPVFENSTRLTIYPYSLDLSDFDDTLKVKALLLEKMVDSNDINYKMKLTKISDANVVLLGNKRSEGDVIELSLSEYGRPIF